VQEHNENVIEQAASQPVEEKGNSEVSSDSASDGGATLSPSAGKQSCSACSDTSYVYALGKVETRISSLSVEKEFAQVIARTNTEGMTDKQALHAVLSDPQNRYLVREVCWVLTVEGLETYILQPNDPNDYTMLVEAVRPVSGRGDVDIVIGKRGPIASPNLCNGLMVPVVTIDQVYSFDSDALVKSIPRPKGMKVEQFEASALDLFDRIMQMADNAGTTDEHRALNYLVVRYDAIYAKVAEAHERNFALTGVDVRASRLSNTRRIVQVIFSFTDRKTDVIEKFFVRVDITEKFPFLVTKLSPYYDR
jgi:hypothetical protein